MMTMRTKNVASLNFPDNNSKMGHSQNFVFSHGKWNIINVLYYLSAKKMLNATFVLSF